MKLSKDFKFIIVNSQSKNTSEVRVLNNNTINNKLQLIRKGEFGKKYLLYY